MAPDKYRVTGSPHYQDGEFHAEGDIVEDVPESILRRFPDKFESVGFDDDGPEAQDEPEATDDTESGEPDDPDEADEGSGADPVSEEQAEAKDEATDDEQEQSDDPDAPSGIPDDHTSLRRIASQNDLGEGVDGRSSSKDIVDALENLSEDEREDILSDTNLDSGE